MAPILKHSLAKPGATDKELAAPVGYGPPLSAHYRSWLHKTGIADLGLPRASTTMGRLVLDRDPDLEEEATQLFMRSELAGDSLRAETWHYFINGCFPEHAPFTREELCMGVMTRLRGHSERHFGPDSTMNPVIINKLIDCYTQLVASGGLETIAAEDERWRRGSPRLAGPWASPEELAQACE